MLDALDISYRVSPAGFESLGALQAPCLTSLRLQLPDLRVTPSLQQILSIYPGLTTLLVELPEKEEAQPRDALTGLASLVQQLRSNATSLSVTVKVSHLSVAITTDAPAPEALAICAPVIDFHTLHVTFHLGGSTALEAPRCHPITFQRFEWRLIIYDASGRRYTAAEHRRIWRRIFSFLRDNAFPNLSMLEFWVTGMTLDDVAELADVIAAPAFPALGLLNLETAPKPLSTGQYGEPRAPEALLERQHSCYEYVSSHLLSGKNDTRKADF